MPQTLTKEDLIKQINEIYRKLANVFFQLSKSYIKKTFDIKPKVYTQENIFNYLKEQGVCESISLSDLKYHLIDWETWKAIIVADWSEQRKYVVDVFDCDNFGFNFSARMADFFELNSAGTAYGWVYDKNTGRTIGAHVFNVILAENNLGVRKIFIYEPITDGYCEYVKGKRVEIGNWQYQVNWVIFF